VVAFVNDVLRRALHSKGYEVPEDRIRNFIV
jgi:hypothetical protein